MINTTHEKRKQAGLCVACGQSRGDCKSKVHCLVCLEKKRVYNRTKKGHEPRYPDGKGTNDSVHSGCSKERRHEYEKRCRQKRQAEGRCQACGKQKEEDRKDKTVCFACMVKVRLHQRKRTGCKPKYPDGKGYLDTAFNKHGKQPYKPERDKAYRRKRIEAGLCVACGKKRKKAEADKTQCRTCLDKLNERNKRLYQERKQAKEKK